MACVLWDPSIDRRRDCCRRDCYERSSFSIWKLIYFYFCLVISSQLGIDIMLLHDISHSGCRGWPAPGWATRSLHHTVPAALPHSWSPQPPRFPFTDHRPASGRRPPWPSLPPSTDSRPLPHPIPPWPTATPTLLGRCHPHTGHHDGRDTTLRVWCCSHLALSTAFPSSPPSRGQLPPPPCGQLPPPSRDGRGLLLLPHSAPLCGRSLIPSRGWDHPRAH